MDAWELDELEAARTESGRLYHEFISVPDLSGGLYVLEAGATDPQSPHTEDELYVLMSGRAMVMVDGEERAIRGRVRDLRGRRGRASLPRHRGASRAPGHVRARGILETIDLAKPRCELRCELRTTARLVVPEEDERIVAGGQEGLESVVPRIELLGCVVVTPKSQIEERSGSSEGRRRLVVLVLGGAQHRAGVS